MTSPDPSTRTEKGVRGFELDAHLTFTRPLPRAEALRVLRVLDGLRADLYAQHGGGEDAPVPSARLTGPLGDPEAVRAALTALLQGEARYIEIGVRGFLRSVNGQTDWMPWRRTAVLPRGEAGRVAFEESVRYVLE